MDGGIYHTNPHSGLKFSFLQLLVILGLTALSCLSQYCPWLKNAHSPKVMAPLLEADCIQDGSVNWYKSQVFCLYVRQGWGSAPEPPVVSKEVFIVMALQINYSFSPLQLRSLLLLLKALFTNFLYTTLLPGNPT